MVNRFVPRIAGIETSLSRPQSPFARRSSSRIFSHIHDEQRKHRCS
jgi:hypothetical protein